MQASQFLENPDIPTQSTGDVSTSPSDADQHCNYGKYETGLACEEELECDSKQRVFNSVYESFKMPPTQSYSQDEDDLNAMVPQERICWLSPISEHEQQSNHLMNNSHEPPSQSTPSYISNSNSNSSNSKHSSNIGYPHPYSYGPKRYSWRRESMNRKHNVPEYDDEDVPQSAMQQGCLVPLPGVSRMDSSNQGLLFQQSPVLFVSQLPAQDIYPRHLFNIFSCFGEVLRVKIMNNNHTKALILFSDSYQAAKALVMNGVNFRGDFLRVRFSTSPYVDPPSTKSCATIRDLTEDYWGKINHRFASNDYARIPWHLPSNKLHVVGFDETIPNIEGVLKQLFSNAGIVESFKLYNTMAWVEMDSISTAVNAVAILHNTSVYAKTGKLIRVSFATYGNK